MRIALIVVITTFIYTKSFAQDPEFSQFYANPLYSNPAFTGVKYGPRFMLNYRNQWPELGNAYITYSTSYDQYFDKFRSGIGVNVVADQQGDGIYSSYSADLMYSYQIRFSHKFNVNMAMEGGYYQKSIDWSKAIFYDQLNPVTGYNIIGPTSEPIGGSIVNGYDFGAGVLLYNKNYYIGLGVKHLVTPQENFIGTDLSATIPRRYTANAGLEFSSETYTGHVAFFSPNVIFMSQANLNQITGGAYAGITPFYMGLYFRHTFENPDAFILLAGFSLGIFKMGYSYDITISSLTTKTGGAHEVSVILNFADKNDETSRAKRAYKKLADCPIIF